MSNRWPSEFTSWGCIISIIVIMKQTKTMQPTLPYSHTPITLPSDISSIFVFLPLKLHQHGHQCLPNHFFGSTPLLLFSSPYPTFDSFRKISMLSFLTLEIVLITELHLYSICLNTCIIQHSSVSPINLY